MAPAASSPSAQRQVGFSRRTQAPRQPRRLHDSPPVKKYRLLTEIMAGAPYAVVERENYSDLGCEQCGSGEVPEELLLCDKCDRGFHMKCVRPIVVRVPIGSWLCPKCQGEKRGRTFSQKKLIDFFGIRRSSGDANDKLSSRDAKKRRKRSAPLVLHKKKRRLLPFIPTKDPAQRLKQMGSLASALTALNMEFSDHLTYLPGMAPRSANQATLENGGMQILSKEDMETVEHCNAMSKRGEFPPFMVVYDSCEGYTVEADDPIKDMTIIAEYTGDVDYLDHRQRDDCDSMMTLLIAAESSQSLVICADKRGNIARFISGINNHKQEGKKKQNCKCVRYSVNGEVRVFWLLHVIFLRGRGFIMIIMVMSINTRLIILSEGKT
ncbi:Histone-lysine N-methyltransferase ATXR5 [Spatholobus suberectus]|nr:Histone-lysine N-methyltransferase ATXR5 [Spatholobus suberectus]